MSNPPGPARHVKRNAVPDGETYSMGPTQRAVLSADVDESWPAGSKVHVRPTDSRVFTPIAPESAPRTLLVNPSTLTARPFSGDVECPVRAASCSRCRC